MSDTYEVSVKIKADGSDLDSTLNRVGQGVQTMSNNISQMGQSAKEKFKDLDNALGGVGQKITALLANPLVLAATAVIALGKAFADTTGKLVEYGDEMSDLSAQTGLSTDALQEYKFAAEQNGTTLSAVTSSIKLMTKGLETNEEIYKKLGVSIKDANGNFRDQNDIFSDTVSALGGVKNETEQSRLALQLFGRGAQEIIPIIKLGKDGLSDLKDQAHALGVVMSEETIRRSGELKDSTEALKGAWKSYSMSLVQDSIPALQSISDVLTAVFTKANLVKQVRFLEGRADELKSAKGDVMAYHDTLLALVEVNKKIAASDKVGLDAAWSNQQIKAYEAELAKIGPAYDKAKLSADSLNAARTSAAQNIEAEAARKKAMEEAEAARQLAIQKAIDEYNSAILESQKLVDAQLISVEKGRSNEVAATQKAAEALANLGAKGSQIYKDLKDDLEAFASAEADTTATKKALEDRQTAYQKHFEELKKKYGDNLSIRELLEKEATDSAKQNETEFVDFYEAGSARMVKAGQDTANATEKYFEQMEKDKQKAAEETFSVISKGIQGVANLATSTSANIMDNTKSLFDGIKSKLPGIAGDVAAVFSAINDAAVAMIKAQEQAYKDLATSTMSAQQTIMANKIKNNQTELANTLKTIDEEEKAALKAAGLSEDYDTKAYNTKISLLKEGLSATLKALDVEEKDRLDKIEYDGLTEKQHLEKKLADAKAAGDAEAQAEAQKALDKYNVEADYQAKKLAAQAEADKKEKEAAEAKAAYEDAQNKIKEEYEAKRVAAQEASAKAARQLTHDQAELDKEITKAQTMIAWQKALSDIPWSDGLSGGTMKKQVNDLYTSLIASIDSITIPAAATGTDYSQAGYYRVGELGPETVYLPQGSKVSNAAETAMGTGRASGNKGMSIKNLNVYSPKANANEMSRALKIQLQQQAFLAAT